MGAETLDELTFSTIVSMISNIIGIPLALVTIRVIREYSKIEPLLFEIKDEQETTTHNTQ